MVGAVVWHYTRNSDAILKKSPTTMRCSLVESRSVTLLVRSTRYAIRSRNVHASLIGTRVPAGKTLVGRGPGPLGRTMATRLLVRDPPCPASALVDLQRQPYPSSRSPDRAPASHSDRDQARTGQRVTNLHYDSIDFDINHPLRRPRVLFDGSRKTADRRRANGNSGG